jgi:uncharacterized surface protein with fasciclin (FAS1) repeats
MGGFAQRLEVGSNSREYRVDHGAQGMHSPTNSLKGNVMNGMHLHKRTALSCILVILALVALGCHGKGSTEKASMTGRMDIVDTAVAAGDFDTLVAAVKAADLVSTLKGPGPFTVFAPTDAAFAKLPPGTLTTLLQPENKAKLASILTYHVVPGKVMAADVVKLSSAKTVNGQSVSITTHGGTVMVDDAKVVQTDIACSNGVIHVIDTVILPK